MTRLYSHSFKKDVSELCPQSNENVLKFLLTNVNAFVNERASCEFLEFVSILHSVCFKEHLWIGFLVIIH